MKDNAKILEMFKKDSIGKLKLMLIRIGGLTSDTLRINTVKIEILESCYQTAFRIKKFLTNIDSKKLEYENNVCRIVRLDTKLLDDINNCLENCRNRKTNEGLVEIYLKLVEFHLYLVSFVEDYSRNKKA